jgi:uncharacterized membrane protein
MKFNLDFWKEVVIIQIVFFVLLVVILMGSSNPQGWTLGEICKNIALIDIGFVICFTLYWSCKKEKRT